MATVSPRLVRLSCPFQNLIYLYILASGPASRRVLQMAFQLATAFVILFYDTHDGIMLRKSQALTLSISGAFTLSTIARYKHGGSSCVYTGHILRSALDINTIITEHDKPPDQLLNLTKISASTARRTCRLTGQFSSLCSKGRKGMLAA